MELFLHDEASFFNCLPLELRYYLLSEFLIPFVIAKRELDQIEPFYEKCWQGCSDIDLIKQKDLLLNNALILDKRIDNGRHKKYEKVFEVTLDYSYHSEITMILLKRGLDLNYFSALSSYCSKVHHKERWMEVYEFLQRLPLLVKEDPSYKQVIAGLGDTHKGRVISLALDYCHEKSLLLFLEHCVCSNFKYACMQENFNADALSLYKKHQVLLDKHIFFM